MASIYDTTHRDTILCLGIDIETMDVRKTAKVLSIGAVLYEIPKRYDPSWEYKEENSFYVNIDPNSYPPAIFTTGKNTMEWWFTQPEAMAQLADNRVSAEVGFDELYKFFYNGDMEGRRPDIVVGKPSHFDMAILEHGFDAIRDSTNRTWVPWKHWEVFCLRSLFTQMDFDQKKIPFVGTVHNALDDARWQAHTHTAAHLEFLLMKSSIEKWKENHVEEIASGMGKYLSEEKINLDEVPF